MHCNLRPSDAAPVPIRLNVVAHAKFEVAQPICCRPVAFLACDCEAVTHAIVIDFLSVSLSVCLSNACIVTKRKHLAKKVQL